MEKKKWEQSAMEIISFKEEDVVRTSGEAKPATNGWSSDPWDDPWMPTRD